MPTVDQLLAQIWAEHQQGNLAGAEAAYRTLLTKAPQNANIHVYLGIALFDLKRYAEAVEHYRAALAIQPNFPIAWNNLGNALRMLGEIQEAESAFIEALQQKPDYLNALKNRGTLWVWSGDLDRALHWYEKALEVNSTDAELHRNLGIIYLLQGRFEEGWKAYRARWQLPGLSRPSLTQPVWQGEPLRGKTLLAYPEQGLGDAIQFVRVLSKLRADGANVIFACEPKLIPLFGGMQGIGRLLPLGAGPLPAVDYHASLVELVDRTWQGTDAISGEPYLVIPENLRQYWAGQLGHLKGIKVGICWQGNRDFHADAYRSMPLKELEPLSKLDGVSLVSLQFGAGSEQLDEVSFGDQVFRLPGDIDRSGGAFLDTAAVITNLDLVITVDTSAGHLAGALGVPTWVLLAKVPDWRWGLQGEQTPWYRHHHLWRQSDQGVWGPVIERMAGQLKEKGQAPL